MKGVDAMARSQNEEAQQKPAERQDAAMSETVLSKVMGKTMQFAATISNKIYDLSLYTGIKLVRTAKRLKKLYLYRFAKCKTEAYARFVALAEKRIVKKADKSPKGEFHVVELFVRKRDHAIAALKKARAEGTACLCQADCSILLRGWQKRVCPVRPCAQLYCSGCRNWNSCLYCSFSAQRPVCAAGRI